MSKLTIFLIPISAVLIISCQPTTKLVATYCSDYKSEDFEREYISEGRIAIMPMNCQTGQEYLLAMLEQEIYNSLVSDFGQDKVVVPTEVTSALMDFNLINDYWKEIDQYEEDDSNKYMLLGQIGEILDVEFLIDINLLSVTRKGVSKAITDINVISRVRNVETGKIVWKGEGGYSAIYGDGFELVQKTADGISSIIGYGSSTGPCGNTYDLEKSLKRTRTFIGFATLIVTPVLLFIIWITTDTSFS